MRALSSLIFLTVLTVAAPQAASAQAGFGAIGSEGKPDRMQQWLVPTPLPDNKSHALLFRPAGNGPFQLVVIAHATTQNALRRAQMPQPEYRALARFLVARGFAVLVPERPGHGATGGKYLEDQGGCDDANYARSGRATADEIASAMNFMRRQASIKPGGVIVVGHSGGGWGALALAAHPDVSAIIVFAAGRGGRADDVPNQVCAPQTLKAAAAEFGKGAKASVTWLIAANDSYFAPAFSRQLAEAFRSAGGKVDFKTLPAHGGEGHWLPETESGVKLAAPELERALNFARPAASRR
ncbi:MAG: alpha/beta fold hydrolase [Bradyrhizobium sp.]|nr:alpha/beta fold hydrolase [Bradyrhizobium sp.]